MFRYYHELVMTRSGGHRVYVVRARPHGDILGTVESFARGRGKRWRFSGQGLDYPHLDFPTRSLAMTALSLARGH